MKNKLFLRLYNQARKLDEKDAIYGFTKEFARKKGARADFRGNSLGPMPKQFKKLFLQEARKWSTLGHDGHFEESNSAPWWKFHQQFEEPLAKMVGCSPLEVAVGNTLSINNVFLISLFLRQIVKKNPNKKKILVARSIFPSDVKSIEYALHLVHGFEGFNLSNHIIYIEPDARGLYDMKSILKVIRENKDIALGFFEAVNYITGQRFPLEQIAKALHSQKALLGVDLAHGVGNISLSLSKWKIDFATWCSYKYLNSGPGAVGGLYVNKKHINSFRYVPGWWGLDENTRFGNASNFSPAKGARRFLASNDQVFNSIGLMADLQLIEKYSFEKIKAKHRSISTYLYNLLKAIPGLEIITPRLWSERGCQISFRVTGCSSGDLLRQLETKNCFCEIRDQYLRVAPVGYNTYAEAAVFAKTLITLVQ